MCKDDRPGGYRRAWLASKKVSELPTSSHIAELMQMDDRCPTTTYHLSRVGASIAEVPHRRTHCEQQHALPTMTPLVPLGLAAPARSYGVLSR